MNQNRVVDLTGKVFGDLTVERYADDGKWLCKCTCGNKAEVVSNKLTSGRTTHCALCRERGFIDITNQRFGRLIAKKYLGGKL